MRWRAGAAVLLALLLVTGAGLGAAGSSGAPAARGTGQPSELRIQVELAVEEVPFGEPFGVTVVRRWSEDLEPEAWSDDLLAPLVLKEVEVERRELEGAVEETRRFRAYAFELEEIEIEAPVFRARERESGVEHTVVGEPIRLLVRAALDPSQPGVPELPRGPFPAPFPWLMWVAQGALAVAVLGLVGAVFGMLRRKGRDAAEAPLSPAERARARLQSLETQRPSSPEDIEAWYTELASIVRELLAVRFALPVEEKTREEILAELESREEPTPEQRQRIDALLAECDHVRFAHVPRCDKSELLQSARVIAEELGTEIDDQEAEGR